ncbi:hypothetical protein ACR6C2_00725 [Streptomyces sp. INA 01156]
MTSDLERNIQEQERIGGNHRPSGAVDRPAAGPHRADDHAAGTRHHPSACEARSRARQCRPALSPEGSGRRARQAHGQKAAAGKAAAKASGTAQTARPTLVDLIRRHLAEQSEPRSAAEISAALGQAHPERGIKTKVVRVTLEGLVAKSQAQRTKQGTSVFYTAPAAPEPTTAAQAETRPEDTGR